MKKKDIDKILNWKTSFTVKIVQWLVILKKRWELFKRGKFKGLKNQEAIHEYDIDTVNFCRDKRKLWISWFARLRNGAEFLEKTIESHIPYFDEIILVDNNSEDATREICLSLQKKYPKIIKCYQYAPEVYKLGSKEYKNVEENSVHCMSYYYNWVLSKTSFKYCIKIDDDHLVIPEVIFPLTQKIKTEWLNSFLSVPLYNIFKKDNQYFLPYKAPFAGLFLDFWFFPLSEKTYFIKDKKCENFIHPLSIKNGPLWFFHLKFLKKELWTINYLGNVKRNIKESIHFKLYPLPKKISDLFIQLWE